MDWPTLLKDYQSGLVGLLGFTGVIITLFVNAYLSRAQHRRVIAHDRRSVRAALLADLTRIRDAFGAQIEVYSDPIPAGREIAMQGRPYRNLQEALLDKLVLLTAQEISSVTRAYGATDTLLPAIRRLKAKKKIDSGIDNEDFIHVSEPLRKGVLGLFKSNFETLSEAVDVLTNASKVDP